MHEHASNGPGELKGLSPWGNFGADQISVRAVFWALVRRLVRLTIRDARACRPEAHGARSADELEVQKQVERRSRMASGTPAVRDRRRRPPCFWKTPGCELEIVRLWPTRARMRPARLLCLSFLGSSDLSSARTYLGVQVVAGYGVRWQDGLGTSLLACL